ncbi:hypothetical protein GGP41_002459 [Bipolaris sorokiniana]|uniref:Zn(2)-C6 fungal-type domain-containing protein n=2 Tax=Cochliobolus sativus TaxID=45130 RepID=A0A8H5ZLB1_COCSA|nr:uncharacterized protein COCSADRAFT_38864 [Bipolaris sorokiniana ND90Pr]EMD62062.1 hypothetical protein COCSADRAFT_38864 [Bipolaris sorokiniana ND90Pr]KAF5850175.1 hypothetical protein GGP41_002459 [Bipolaris sorokiniana]
MSHAQQYDNSSNEGWQDLISWNGELYDPFFQGETNYTQAQGGSFSADSQLSGSYTSEPPYLVSKAPSVTDLPPSLDYTPVSASPSVLDEQSSLNYAYIASPSLDKATTSPLAVPRETQFYGSFGASDNALLSPLADIAESIILDTRYDRIPETFSLSTGSQESTAETVFNPHVTGSSHSFSGLDMRASRAFSTWHAWSDQPRIIEPIPEDDGGRTEAMPIPIPQSLSQSYNITSPSYPSYSPYPRSDGGFELHSHSRAIAIPDAARRPASYNSRTNNSGSVRRVATTPSLSPAASRHPRAIALSRSASLSRRKSSTPSPTSDSYGWVSYQPNPLTNKLSPITTDGLSGRAQKGRKKALTPEQRRDAALMRIVRACSNCQKRKEKCDPGMPCKACLEHYKGDLVNHPCRGHTLSDLSGAFLSDRLGWHPTARNLESFIPTRHFKILTDTSYTVPINFGFGPAFPVSVNAIELDDHPLVHDHIVYSWPPEPFSGPPHRHAVLPAVLCADAQANLLQTLDSHLSLLVTQHFHNFPLYCSPLRILREVCMFSCSLPKNTLHYRVLHDALKLLVLVHVGGDITLPSLSESWVLAQLISSTMTIAEDLTPTPCFIRSQFGAAMPNLAHDLMKRVLSSLEQFLLNKDCDEWPIAVAVLITVLMTIESVHYHAAKLPYHNFYDETNAAIAEEDLTVNEQGVSELLDFYKACFSGCHARLRLDWEGESSQPHTPADKFIAGLQAAIRQANDEGYLTQKSKATRGDDDMGYFFDRLVVRLLKQ